VFNLSNFTSENNPHGRSLSITAPAIDTWTRAVVHPPGRLAGHGTGSLGTKVTEALTSWLRRLCGRMFASSDTEANWRGWEVINSYGGLGRRYRDPMFDLLGTCPGCQGAGSDTNGPCDVCLGTGRVAFGGDDDIGEVS